MSFGDGENNFQIRIFKILLLSIHSSPTKFIYFITTMEWINYISPISFAVPFEKRLTCFNRKMLYNYSGINKIKDQ